MKKRLKKFLKYFSILLTILVVLVALFFGVLYFFPGTSILGYEYIQYGETVTREFTQTDLSSEGINSIRVECSGVNIVVEPTEAEKVQLSYVQQVNGFTRSIDASILLDTKFVASSFEDHTEGNYKSLVISITEPSGALVASSSTAYIYLPKSYKVPILYCKSSNNIWYTAKKTGGNNAEYSTSVDDIYFTTYNSGKITLDCDSGKKLNLKTELGDVVLSRSSFSAEKIKFDTKAGGLKFNSDGETSLNLSDKLEIASYNGEGTKLNLGTLNGDLLVNSTGGSYKIKTVGSQTVQRKVLLNSTNSNFDFDTVNGFVSLQNSGDSGKNVFKASTINNTSSTNTNVLQVGSGSVNVKKLIGPSSLSSTSGTLYVGEIEKNSSIYAISESGKIDLTYEASPSSLVGTSINIFSSTGDVYLKNISGILKVDILSSSAEAKLDIVFTAVCNDETNIKENVISANDRDVALTLKGFTDDFKFRYLTSTRPVFDAKIDQSQVSSSDGEEYLLNADAYKGYAYQYRCGYKKDVSIAVINANYGRLLVSTTGTARMFVDLSK